MNKNPRNKDGIRAKPQATENIKPDWYARLLHDKLLANCTPAQLELARTFQRLAFASPNSKDDYRRLGLGSDDFQPAPIYVRQALACFESPVLHLQLIVNLQRS